MESPVPSPLGASRSSAPRANRPHEPLGTLSGMTARGSPGPGTPGRLMMEDDARLERAHEGEIPPTPPRRLLDVFLESAGRTRSPGTDSTGSELGRSRSRTGSPSPSVSLSANTTRDEDDDDATPAWTFYHDSDEAGQLPSPSPAPPSDPSEPDGMDLDDEPKENAPPSPRRPRSSSLLSQPTLVASPARVRSASVLPPGAHLPASATSRTALPPRSRPSLSTISTTTEDLDATQNDDSEDTEEAEPVSSPTSNPSSIFPSWVETSRPNGFSEGATDNMASLLPGFSLAFSPRKRQSLGEAGGDEKRVRLDASDSDDT